MLAITVAVLAVRLWFAARVSFCGTPDSCFYLGLAQSLGESHRFRVPFVFDLLLPHLSLPATGLEYWRPGTSLLLWAAHPWSAPTLGSGVALASMAGVVWALAARSMAWRAWASHGLAAAAYALALVLPVAWEGSLTPDSTLFYGAAVAWFLALFTVRRQSLATDIAALCCVGAAYLIRNDALLLLAPFATVLGLRYRAGVADRHGGRRAQGAAAAYLAAMGLGFMAALAPMHVLYARVLGTAFPAGANQALFLFDLSDFVQYRAPANLHSLLAHGARALIAVRALTLALIAHRVLASVLGFPALLFLLVLLVRNDAGNVGDGTRRGPAWKWLCLPEMAGPVVFAGTLLGVYTLVLPAVGVFSALRSAAGLMPWAAVLTVAGIVRAARTRQVAMLLVGGLLIVYTVTGIGDDRREMDAMNALGAKDRELAAELAGLGAGAAGLGDQPATSGGGGRQVVVMTADPVQFAVTTGLPSIALPGNGLDAMLREASDLHATHVILNSEHLPANADELCRALHATRRVIFPAQHAMVLVLPKGSPQGSDGRPLPSAWPGGTMMLDGDHGWASGGSYATNVNGSACHWRRLRRRPRCRCATCARLRKMTGRSFQAGSLPKGSCVGIASF